MLVSVLLLAMAAFEEPAIVRAAPMTPAEKIDEDVLRQLFIVRRVLWTVCRAARQPRRCAT